MNPLNLLVFILIVCLIVGVIVTLVPWAWLQIVLAVLTLVVVWRAVVDRRSV